MLPVSTVSVLIGCPYCCPEKATMHSFTSPLNICEIELFKLLLTCVPFAVRLAVNHYRKLFVEEKGNEKFSLTVDAPLARNFSSEAYSTAGITMDSPRLCKSMLLYIGST